MVRVAEKLGNEDAAWTSIEFDRCADLLDSPIGHHCDPIRHLEGFAKIMGHEHGREPGRPLDLAQLGAQLRAQLGVKIAHRLIQQQEPWSHDDRSGKGYTLLLAA